MRAVLSNAGRMSKADDTRLKDARARFKLGQDAIQHQIKPEEVALRFYDLEQWTTAEQKSRAGVDQVGPVPGTPARPMMVIDKLREPVHQIVNQERESDLSIELIPADDFGSLAQPADPSEIELREGLIRRIQRESESASARTWAFQRAAICGRGFYAINTRYVEGPTFDQEVYCRRIYNQFSVVLDPAHEEPDGSDAEWGFIFTTMSYDAYKSEYPEFAKKYKGHAGRECNDEEWLAFDEAEGDEKPGWFTVEGKVKYLRIAEHWYTERKSTTIYQLADGRVVQRLRKGMEAVNERTVVEKSVKWCKMDGCQTLDETDWPSPYIPIVKVVGNEIPPYDDKRRFDGIINKSAIEQQRGVNYAGSRFMEELGNVAVSPVLAVEGTLEPYTAWWNQANVRAFPYLYYKQTDLEGRTAQPPFRPDKRIEVGQYTTALQVFMEGIQTSTGVTDPAAGKPNRYSETWRGTQALINQSERGTSNYMDNLARSVRYEGRIVNSLLYPIYGQRPGRLARIVDGEGEAETIIIDQPFTMVDNGQGQERPQPAPGMNTQQEGVRQYKLTKDFRANVAVKVTKGYDTRRQEEAAVMGEIVTQQPQMMTVIGDLFFGAQDWPGAKEAKERFKVMLDPKVQAMLDSQKGGQAPIPPQALQQMQQQQQQLQQVTQAAQQMQQELQTQQFKVQSEERIAMAKLQTEREIAAAKMENERLIAAAKIQAEHEQAMAKEEAELHRQRLDQQHASTEAAMGANREAEAAEAQRASDAMTQAQESMNG